MLNLVLLLLDNMLAALADTCAYQFQAIIAGPVRWPIGRHSAALL